MSFLSKFRTFIEPGLFQFSIAFFLLLFIWVYENLGLPNSSEISQSFINVYKEYGLVIIFIAAFLEALFVISMYLPASLVIVLSAFAFGFDTRILFQIGILSLLGFTLANVVNFYLGKYGYYKILLKLGGKKSILKVQRDFQKHSFKTIFLTAFHPNFLAITMISAGITKSNLFRVLLQSMVSLVFWITTWMVLITILLKDSLGSLTENNNTVCYFLIIIIVWGIIKCIRGYK